MKDKILSALKIKFKNLGFTDKAFEGMAEYLTPTVTEETQIETAIGGVEPLLKAFQGDVDSRVNQAIDKTKKDLEKTKGPNDPPEPTKVDPPADETPTDKIIRLLTEQNKALDERLNKIEGGNTTQSRSQQLETLLKDANPAFKKIVLDNFEFVKDADEAKFTSFMEKTTTGLAEFTQSLTESGLTAVKGPQIIGVLPANGAEAQGNTFVSDSAALKQHRLDQKAAEEKKTAV